MNKKKLFFAGVCLFLCISATKIYASGGLSNSLKTCTPYEETFEHPFTGEKMKRKIYGIQNNKCYYQETMPGNMVMECRYPLNMLGAISKYYYNSEHASQVEATVTLNPDGSHSSTGSIDGKEIDNILNKAMEQGICFVK